MFGFGKGFNSIVPITYTEITRDGDEIYKNQKQIGVVYADDLLVLSEAMKKISGEVRV